MRDCRAGAVAALILVASAIGGCSTTMKAASLDPSGRFATADRMTAAEIMVTKPFDKGRFGATAYVKTDSKSATLDQFFIDSVVATKTFTTVYDAEGLQKQVIARSKAAGGDVAFTDNLVGWHQVAKTLGPFLVIEPYVEWKGGYNFEASLKVIDPDTTETLFLARRKAFNWAGLDKPLFYPLFNAFIDWTQGVAPPPAPPKAAAH